MRIEPRAKHVTMINAFTVRPEDQDELISLITETATTVMSDQPGALGNALHRSTDGTKVVNYVQWRDEPSLRAALATPAAEPLFERMLTIATAFDHNLYEVIFLGSNKA